VAESAAGASVDALSLVLAGTADSARTGRLAVGAAPGSAFSPVFETACSSRIASISMSDFQQQVSARQRKTEA
jgi:hypothetical protein